MHYVRLLPGSACQRQLRMVRGPLAAHGPRVNVVKLAPALWLPVFIALSIFEELALADPHSSRDGSVVSSWAALWSGCASVCELLVCTSLHDSMSTITLFRLVHALTTTSCISFIVQHFSLITQHYFIFANTRVFTSPVRPYHACGYA